MEYKLLSFIIISFCFWSCNSQTNQQGRRIYEAQCSQCHMDDGSGLQKNIPALATSNIIRHRDLQSLISIIKKGKNADSIGIAMNVMPSHQEMTEAELYNICDYLFMRWADEKKHIDLQEFRIKNID